MCIRDRGYAERCTAAIREITGWDVTLAEDLVGATSDTVCMVCLLYTSRCV